MQLDISKKKKEKKEKKKGKWERERENRSPTIITAAPLVTLYYVEGGDKFWKFVRQFYGGIAAAATAAVAKQNAKRARNGKQ